MNEQGHASGLGRLMASQHSLEATLRMFLTQANPSENYVTKWASLGKLVKKYNGQLSKDERSLYSVDASVVKIRNAVAHGLVSRKMKGFPLTLLHVASGLEVEMTIEWFKERRVKVREQINRISACGRKRWPKSPWWG